MPTTKTRFLYLYRFQTGTSPRPSSPEEMQAQYAAWSARPRLTPRGRCCEDGWRHARPAADPGQNAQRARKAAINDSSAA